MTHDLGDGHELGHGKDRQTYVLDGAARSLDSECHL